VPRDRIFLAWLLAAIALVTMPAIAGSLVGSKHDLTSLNERAGVDAMSGLAFNDYGDPCIYCHIPTDGSDPAPNAAPGKMQIENWNRYMPQGEFQRYKRPSMTAKMGELGPQSLLCLSCHDGTMAVDMVVNKPNGWTTSDDAPLHMRLDKGGGLERCTQCHDGTTAHRMDTAVIGRNLMDDHPIGIAYPGLFDNPDFFRPGADGRFRNGVRLFDQQVECATCHNVHDPDISPFLRVEPSELCITCHNK